MSILSMKNNIPTFVNINPANVFFSFVSVSDGLPLYETVDGFQRATAVGFHCFALCTPGKVSQSYRGNNTISSINGGCKL